MIVIVLSEGSHKSMVNENVMNLGTTNSKESRMFVIGLSSGGAKDIYNFRQNIANGFMPSKTDITMEGIFYDYYFDTGKNGNSNNNDTNDEKFKDVLFYPSYSQGISGNPMGNTTHINEKDYFMSIGLNSNIKQSDFKRKKLNLVVVLDISGSMNGSFRSYYYGSPNAK